MKPLLHNPIAGFLLRFVLIYGLLIFPWPGWNELYGEYFRGLGQVVFSRDDGNRLVLFEHQELKHPNHNA